MASTEDKTAYDYATAALSLIKVDKSKPPQKYQINFIDKKKMLNEAKATKNEYTLTSMINCSKIMS